MDNIGPFVKLPQLPFFICKVCRYAYTGKEVQQHLRKHHKSITAEERNKIIATVQRIPDVIQKRSDLATWPLPPPTTDPIPFIHPPSQQLGCGEEGCLHAFSTIRGMQEHYRKKHRWINPRGRGGSAQKRAIEAQQVPWRTGVQCQRLFSNGPGSSWFEVGFGGQASQAAPEEAAIIDRMNRAMEQQQRRFEMEDKEKIKAADARMDANAWLEHVGWATHLEGFDPEAMLRLTDPVSEHEHALQLIQDSLIRVMSQARAIATPAQVGSQALFEAQRKEVDKKPRRPFDNRMEDDLYLSGEDVIEIFKWPISYSKSVRPYSPATVRR